MSKYVSLDNLTRYDEKIKDYIDKGNLFRKYVGVAVPLADPTDPYVYPVGNYTFTVTYIESGTYSLSVVSSVTKTDVALIIPYNNQFIRVGDLVANTAKTYTINALDDEDFTIYIYENFGTYSPEVSITGDYDDLINKPTTFLGNITDYDSSSEALDVSNLKVNTVYSIVYNAGISTLPSNRYLYIKIPYNNDTTVYSLNVAKREIGGYTGSQVGGIIYVIVLADITESLPSGTKLVYVVSKYTTGTVIDYFTALTSSISSGSYTQVNTSSAVSLTGDQTISGVKTFNSFPQAQGTPTLNTELINKGFADTTYASKTDVSSLITYGTTDLSPGDTLPDGTIYIVYDNN